MAFQISTERPSDSIASCLHLGELHPLLSTGDSPQQKRIHFHPQRQEIGHDRMYVKGARLLFDLLKVPE